MLFAGAAPNFILIVLILVIVAIFAPPLVPAPVFSVAAMFLVAPRLSLVAVSPVMPAISRPFAVMSVGAVMGPMAVVAVRCTCVPAATMRFALILLICRKLFLEVLEAHSGGDVQISNSRIKHMDKNNFCDVARKGP